MKGAMVLSAFVLVGILIGVAFYLVWINRASERVVSATLPIALAAVAGVFLTVFVFSDEPSVSVAFPVTFFHHREGALPVGMSFRRDHDAAFLMARLLKQNPEKAADGQQGGVLYHHLLQKALFEWIVQKHFSVWDSEHLNFATGTRYNQGGRVRDRSEPSLKLTRVELEKIMAGNLFAAMAISPLDLAVPPGTVITVRAPESGTEGEIIFENRLCKLSIATTFAKFSVGLDGYLPLLSLSTDEAQKLYSEHTYTVRGTASFTRYRIGDPRLPLVKRWAVQILEGLRNEFDEQITWREAKDAFLLRQQSGPGGFTGRGSIYGFNPN